MRWTFSFEPGVERPEPPFILRRPQDRQFLAETAEVCKVIGMQNKDVTEPSLKSGAGNNATEQGDDGYVLFLEAQLLDLDIRRSATRLDEMLDDDFKEIGCSGRFTMTRRRSSNSFQKRLVRMGRKRWRSVPSINFHRRSR